MAERLAAATLKTSAESTEETNMQRAESRSRWSVLQGMLFLLLGAILVADGTAAQVTLVEASKVLDRAEAEVMAAKQAGAEKYASEELKLARKTFEKARTEIYAAKYKKGMKLAEKATELAAKAKAKALRIAPPTSQAVNTADQGKEHPPAKSVNGSAPSEKKPQAAKGADVKKAPGSGPQPSKDAKKPTTKR